MVGFVAIQEIAFCLLGLGKAPASSTLLQLELNILKLKQPDWRLKL